MNIRSILALAPVIPVITVEHIDHAVPLARALCAGGLRVLEVTLRTPVALPAIEAMRKAVPDAVVGVGTLARPGDFVTAGNAGAQFGVSPGLTAEMAAAARAASFPMLPGIMTPTELLAGLGWGYDTFKLFPAQQAGGIGMLKALGAPFPKWCSAPPAASLVRPRRTSWRCPMWHASAAHGSHRRTGFAREIGQRSRRWRKTQRRWQRRSNVIRRSRRASARLAGRQGSRAGGSALLPARPRPEPTLRSATACRHR